MVEVLRESQPRARKQHTCDSCMGTIEPGEVYYHQVMNDGGLCVFKSHARCRRASLSLIGACPDSFTYCDEMPNVSDFEDEDWETIQDAAPDLYAEFMARTNGYGPMPEGG